MYLLLGNNDILIIKKRQEFLFFCPLILIRWDVINKKCPSRKHL